jgi:aryl-alcohol dehydrogenase-like predicted oxidoreductase
MSAVERSLKFLNTDYVDVYLVHWPDVNTPFEETMRTLDDIVKQGKARFVGVSNFTLSQLKACMSVRRVDIVQYGYHLFDRRMEKEIFPYCAENGIGVMAYGSLAHGLLTGTFTEETKFEETDWRSKGGAFGLKPFAPENFPRNVRAVNDLKPIAQKHGKKMSHLALRWVLSNPAVSVALVGARNPAEVEDNMGALGWSLSEVDQAEMDKVFQKYGIDVKPDVWLEQ